MSRMLIALRQLQAKTANALLGEPSSEGVAAPLHCPADLPSTGQWAPTTAPSKSDGMEEPVSPGLPAASHRPPGQSSRPATAFEQSLLKTLESEPHGQQYRRLVNNIVSRFPDPHSASLLFVGVGQDPHLAIALAHVAALMAGREQGDVLLVDGNSGEASLTDRFEAQGMPGLAEILNRRRPWGELLIPASIDRLAFLPVGHGLAGQGKSAIGELGGVFGEWKRRYRFVLVDAGGARLALAQALARVCDGTYFLVRLGQTDSAEASAAVAQIQTTGARLLGCVVINVN